jgi:hypothetical protein
VFRLYDMRARRAEEIRPGRRGQLVTYLASPGGAGQTVADDPRAALADDLRAALVADLIRRVAERHHLVVDARRRGAADPGAPAGPAGAAPRTTADDLNIHPAQAAPGPPGSLDVQIAGEAPGTEVRWIRPAGVAIAGTPGDGTLDGGLVTPGVDPLSLRLVCLRRHHQQPVSLGRDALGDADEKLRGWRALVADWARSPSKPMCAQYVADATGAFDDDLDTPTALTVLDALAGDEVIPPGSKFETFAHLDRLFGLDLAREVGR